MVIHSHPHTEAVAVAGDRRRKMTDGINLFKLQKIRNTHRQYTCNGIVSAHGRSPTHEHHQSLFDLHMRCSKLIASVPRTLFLNDDIDDNVHRYQKR